MFTEDIEHELVNGDIIRIVGDTPLYKAKNGEYYCVYGMLLESKSYVLVKYKKVKEDTYVVEKPYTEIYSPIVVIDNCLVGRFSITKDCIQLIVAHKYYKFKEYFVKMPEEIRPQITSLKKISIRKFKGKKQMKKQVRKKEPELIVKGVKIGKEIRLSELGKLLNISKSSLRRKICKNILKGYKKKVLVGKNLFTKSYFVKRKDLREYLSTVKLPVKEYDIKLRIKSYKILNPLGNTDNISNSEMSCLINKKIFPYVKKISYLIKTYKEFGLVLSRYENSFLKKEVKKFISCLEDLNIFEYMYAVKYTPEKVSKIYKYLCVIREYLEK